MTAQQLYDLLADLQDDGLNLSDIHLAYPSQNPGTVHERIEHTEIVQLPDEIPKTKAMTPQHQYEKETGKSVWKIKDHTYTDEYSAWIKNYAKNSYSPEAKIIREFSNKLKQKEA